MPQHIRDPASADDATVKTRRSHRKSRNGYLECKHRHIRCDERKPACANCEAAERVCSFLAAQTTKMKHNKRQRPHTKNEQPKAPVSAEPENSNSIQSNIKLTDHADIGHTGPSLLAVYRQPELASSSQKSNIIPHQSLLAHFLRLTDTGHDGNPHRIPSPASVQPTDIGSPPAGSYPGFTSIPVVAQKPLFTTQHMVLLHHAYEVPNLVSPNRNLVDIAVRHTIGSPYLLDEVLAFTAFHMAYLYPGSAVYLRHVAAELQNRALVSFTRLTEQVPKDDKLTAVPRFMFSAILGRHVLADTLNFDHSDFHVFIDRFVDCINLCRGIKTVVPPAWDFLKSTEVEPFLTVVNDARKKVVSTGHEFDALEELMTKSDLNEISVEACRQAIKTLQWSFDLCHHLEVDDYLQAVSVFSVGVNSSYTDVLRKHQSEALIILAYYGVLLYRCRSFWAFGNAGASMIHAIAGRLGSYWQAALTWPLCVIRTEHES